MPDPVLAQTPSPSPMAAPGPAIPPSGPQGLPDLNKAAGDMRAGLKRVDDTESRTMAALEGERASRDVPKYTPPPQPQTKETTPQEAWASSAMMLAVVGSLITRTPLKTAMNAAAEAIKGFHQGDLQAFDNATKTWEISTKNAIEMANFQQEAYDKAMGDITRRENLSEKDAANSRHEIMAEWTAVASQFQHEAMLTALNTRDWAQVQHVYIANKAATERQKVDFPKALQAADDARLTLQLSQDPEFKKAQASGDARKMHEMGVQWGIIKEANDPLKDEKTKEGIKKNWEASVPGKGYEIAKQANGDIQAYVADPNVQKNPADQIALVDKAIFLDTGSIRPGLAQYQKLLGAATAKDIIAMKMGQLSYHPILGPDQIRNIGEFAQRTFDNREKQYHAYLMDDPQRRWLAEQIGELPKGHGQNDRGPQYEHDTGVLRDMIAKDPAHKAALVKHFDSHYGEGSAEETLGAQ